MARRTDSFRSPAKVARRLRVLPAAVRALSSWPRFVVNYAVGRVPARPYRFRTGARLKVTRGVEHLPVIEVFLRRDYGTVGDGWTVLDLGASVGVFALYATSAAAGVRVVAYEPSPAAFATLLENRALNAKAWEVVNAAVGGDPGRRTLSVAVAGVHFPHLADGAQPEEAVEVACTTLAAALADHGLSVVDLLKADIEGAEYETFYRTHPETFARILRVRMEAHDLDDDTRNAAALGRFLEERGYRVTRLEPSGERIHNLWAERPVAA